MKYKTVKLFDCQDFPAEIKEKLFKFTSNHHINYGNDICIDFDLTEWHHMGEEIFREEYPTLLADVLSYLGDELLGQEVVVIKHWW